MRTALVYTKCMLIELLRDSFIAEHCSSTCDSASCSSKPLRGHAAVVLDNATMTRMMKMMMMMMTYKNESMDVIGYRVWKPYALGQNCSISLTFNCRYCGSDACTHKFVTNTQSIYKR